MNGSVNKNEIIESILRNNINDNEFILILKQIDSEINDIYRGNRILVNLVNNKEISWRRLSAGTKKMIELFGSLQYPCKDIKILFIRWTEESLK